LRDLPKKSGVLPQQALRDQTQESEDTEWEKEAISQTAGD